MAAKLAKKQQRRSSIGLLAAAPLRRLSKEGGSAVEALRRSSVNRRSSSEQQAGGNHSRVGQVPEEEETQAGHEPLNAADVAAALAYRPPKPNLLARLWARICGRGGEVHPYPKAGS